MYLGQKTVNLQIFVLQHFMECPEKVKYNLEVDLNLTKYKQLPDINKYLTTKKWTTLI